MSHYKNRPPPFPSNILAIEEMLTLAEVTPGKDVVYDIGARDGRIPIRAVQEPFNARYAVGIEISKFYADIAKKRVVELKLQDKVRIIHRDAFRCNLSKADVVTLYLNKDTNEEIRPKLEKQLKKTARVACNFFEMERWKCWKHVRIKVPIGDDTKNPWVTPIYVYKMSKI